MEVDQYWCWNLKPYAGKALKSLKNFPLKKLRENSFYIKGIIYFLLLTKCQQQEEGLKCQWQAASISFKFIHP